MVFSALVFRLSVWCGAEGYVSGFQTAAAARKPDTYPSAPHHTDNLKTKALNTTGSVHLYNTLEPLMMGIVLPETCWAFNKIYNKYHLLHLVGILFPHNSDIIFIYKEWSKSHLAPGKRIWTSSVKELLCHSLHFSYAIIEGKAVPLQAWSGPEGSRKLRFPDFMTTTQDGKKVMVASWGFSTLRQFGLFYS